MGTLACATWGMQKNSKDHAGAIHRRIQKIITCAALARYNTGVMPILLCASPLPIVFMCSAAHRRRHPPSPSMAAKGGYMPHRTASRRRPQLSPRCASSSSVRSLQLPCKTGRTRRRLATLPTCSLQDIRSILAVRRLRALSDGGHRRSPSSSRTS